MTRKTGQKLTIAILGQYIGLQRSGLPVFGAEVSLSSDCCMASAVLILTGKIKLLALNPLL